jgi:DNA-binding transcriptional regulator YdaS (Cro superfamily)
MILREWLDGKKAIDKKHTDKAFSQVLGVSACYLSKIAEHRHKPSKKMAQRIVELTGGAVTLDDLNTVYVRYI